MEAYLGTICAFGFNYAPYGWQYCNGQVLAISQNAALFSLLGTYYGGNGTSTFGLPNLQGRAAVCQGQLAGGQLYSIGETGGSETVTVLSSNLPAHTHPVSVSVNASRDPGAGSVAQNSYPAGSSGDPAQNDFNSTASPGVFMKPISVTLGNQGGTTPININDPYLVLNYSIAMQGIFPTRN